MWWGSRASWDGRYIKTNKHSLRKLAQGNKHEPCTEAMGQTKACDWTVTFDRHAGEKSTQIHQQRKEGKTKQQSNRSCATQDPSASGWTSTALRKWLFLRAEALCPIVALCCGFATSALLERNRLNPLGPAFVAAEGFFYQNRQRRFGNITLDRAHYPCFTCFPPAVFLQGSVTKKSGLLSPSRKLVCTCTIG